MYAPRSIAIVLLVLAVIAGTTMAYALPGTVAGPTITVQGAITVDTGESIRPVEGITVKLYDRDRGANEFLAQTTTDAEGRFMFTEIPNTDLDGPGHRPDAGQDIFVIITTQGEHAEVQNPATGNKPFKWNSDSPELLGANGLYPDVPNGATIAFPTIEFRRDTANREALQIQETLVRGWRFVAEEQGLADPGKTVARWSAQSFDGPRYDPSARVIYLASGDASYPDQILRLQGVHFMMWQYGSLPSGCTGGGDIRIQTTQPCAWVDGWGLFFQAAVQNDPNYSSPTGSINIESPLVTLDDGDAVGARVGGALWDLLDDHDDLFDQYTPDPPENGFRDIWNVFTSGTLITFREFWDAWGAAGLPLCAPVAAIFQNTINYNSPPVLNPLRDVVLDEDQVLDPPIDLWPLASDLECMDEELLFQVEGVATETVQIEIEDNQYLRVVPALDWHGEITVNIQAFDGAEVATQPLHITVRSINDPPRIEPRIPDRNVLQEEPIIFQLAGNITDPDHDDSQLTLSVEVWEEQVAFTWMIDGLNVTFTPTGPETGVNVIDIVVTDPEGASGRQRVFLTWEQLPNQAPVISANLPTVWEAHKGQEIVMNLLEFATDDRNSPSQLAWFVDPDTLDNATMAGAGSQVLRFMPDPADFLGDDTITLIVKDRDGAQSEQEIILRWTPLPNIAPFINPPIPDQEIGINQLLVVDLRPYGQDLDDNRESLRWYVEFVDPEAPNPFVTGQGTQVLTFRPVVDFEGSIRARFVVRDPKGAEASQIVTLTWRKFQVYLPLFRQPFMQKP